MKILLAYIRINSLQDVLAIDRFFIWIIWIFAALFIVCLKDVLTLSLNIISTISFAWWDDSKPTNFFYDFKIINLNKTGFPKSWFEII